MTVFRDITFLAAGPASERNRSRAEKHPMREGAVIPPASTLPPRTTDTAAGVSVLLTALAIGFALAALGVINSTYERYRGRTDLDMPDWFGINWDLTVKVLPLGAAGGLCLLVSGVLFLGWAGRAGWTMQAGFVAQWLVSAAIVGMMVWSRFP
jgi:hypothetical protein